MMGAKPSLSCVPQRDDWLGRIPTVIVILLVLLLLYNTVHHDVVSLFTVPTDRLATIQIVLSSDLYG
jgi:hypothetical protein